MSSSAKSSVVAKALKAHDLETIKKVLQSSNASDKRAILDQLLLDDPAAKGDLLSTVVFDKAQFQKEEQFRALLVKFISKLGASDPVVKEYMESAMLQSQCGKMMAVPLGSGPDGKTLDHYFCANLYVQENRICKNKGNLNCKDCGLVGYCSRACQRQHWPQHKTACLKQSQFRDAVWKPNWEIENRPPAFTKQEEVVNDSIHLWGNSPAFDLINFPSNEHKEGRVWQEEMRVLFAASGDFRSMVETLASVPQSHNQPIEIVINDRETMVVARNLLMTAMLLLKGEEAIDTAINLWYSVTVRHQQLMAHGAEIVKNLLPASGKKQGTVNSGKSSIELNDMKSAIQFIAQTLQKTTGFDRHQAVDRRMAVMFNPARQDYMDRKLLAMKEFHREAFTRFRAQGLLLPFESLNAHISISNTFLFSADREWLLPDTADPKNGWDMNKVMEFGNKRGLPKNDLDGRLFFYIRDRLTKMVATLRRIPVKIRFFQMDARDLAKKFKREKLSFDRIDVSNVSLGINTVLNDWAPLLNKSNPNSALLTLFRNWDNSGASAQTTTSDDVTKEARDFLGIRPGHISNVFEKFGFNLLQVTAMGKLSSTPTTIMGDKDVARKGMQFMGLDPSNLETTKTSMMEYLMPAAIGAFTDTSSKFQQYLDRELKKRSETVKRRMEHTIVPHRAMLPLDAPVDATLDYVEKEKQYFAFNWGTNPMNRYVEWGL